MIDDLKARLRGSCYISLGNGTKDYRAATYTADYIEALELALTQSRAETAAAYERTVKAVTDAHVFSDDDTDAQSAAKVIALGRAAKAIRALATPDQTDALAEIEKGGV